MLYANKDYADKYHGTRLTGAAWAALPDPIKSAALQSASDAMDAYAVSKGGWRESRTSETVPEALKAACCIEAMEMTRPETEARRRAQQQGLRAISIGSASESYAENSSLSSNALCSTQAQALLKPYVKYAGGGVTIR